MYSCYTTSCIEQLEEVLEKNAFVTSFREKYLLLSKTLVLH